VGSLPPFSLYSLAGAVDRDIGGDKDCSGNCGNVRTAWVGVGGLPGVLLTKMLVLLRYGGVVGALSIPNSGVIALTLALVRLLISSLSLLLFWAAVNPGVLALSTSGWLIGVRESSLCARVKCLIDIDKYSVLIHTKLLIDS
jgi:hypothetical protein